MDKDFTIVVQGNLHPHGMGCLDLYREYGQVIVSFWSDNDKRLLPRRPMEGVTFIENPKFRPQSHVYNAINIYYQLFTTLSGVLRSRSPYTIKVRCDEKFSTLDPVVSAVRERPECYTCLDVYFRPHNFMANHPSDHLVGSATMLLRQALELGKSMCEDIVALQTDYFLDMHVVNVDYFLARKAAEVLRGRRFLCPEIVWGDSFVRSKGIDPRTLRCKDMQDHYQIIPTASVGFRNKHDNPHVNYIAYPEIRSMKGICSWSAKR